IRASSRSPTADSAKNEQWGVDAAGIDAMRAHHGPAVRQAGEQKVCSRSPSGGPETATCRWQLAARMVQGLAKVGRLSARGDDVPDRAGQEQEPRHRHGLTGANAVG